MGKINVCLENIETEIITFEFNRQMEATKNADLDECFNEFDTNDDDNQENRQLEIHLSGGVFQSKLFVKTFLRRKLQHFFLF